MAEKKWDQKKIDELSEVSSADLEEAKAWARKHGSPEPGGVDPTELLEAEPGDDS